MNLNTFVLSFKMRSEVSHPAPENAIMSARLIIFMLQRDQLIHMPLHW